MESKNIRARKKISLYIIMGAIAFVLAYSIIQQLFFSTVSFGQQMKDAADELTKNCPVMIDEHTRLDSVLALPNNVFEYKYTLTTLNKSGVSIDSIKAYLEPALVHNVRTSSDLAIFRRHHVTIVYNYKDKNGLAVLRVAVTPDLYK